MLHANYLAMGFSPTYLFKKPTLKVQISVRQLGRPVVFEIIVCGGFSQIYFVVLVVIRRLSVSLVDY